MSDNSLNVAQSSGAASVDMQTTTTEINPLLEAWSGPHATPAFDRFRNEDYMPAFQQTLKEARAEVEAIVLGKKPRTQYYTEENGLVIRDTVSLNGNDWTFAQHKVIDTMPTEEDFRKTVADYLAWKVSQAIKGDGGYGV